MSQSLDASERAARLGCWRAPVTPEPIAGGITNQNFAVEHRGRRYFVRIGDDLPVHGVMRFNEVAASRAAAAAELSPRVVHSEPGALVLEFIEGETLDEAAVRAPGNLERVVALVRRCHLEVPRHLRGPALAFSVFHALRDYGHTLRDADSRMVPALSRLEAIAARLESEAGAFEPVFAHNDLLAGNFIDDGERLWLIDWDYAGFGSALFDLGGLGSNNQLDADAEAFVLERYFEEPVSPSLRRRYEAMKCASLLRESFWSMVSEHHSTLDFDYVAYTTENLERFERAYAAFEAAHG